MAELTPELIADLTLPQEPQLSPDGRRAAYTLVRLSKHEEHEVSAIWVAPTDGSRPPHQFTAGVAHDFAPQWSPDGTQLAFLSDRAQRGTAQLYLMPADGGEARALTPATNKRAVLGFAWSPGGGQIAFTSADEPTADDERREKERDDAEVYGERWEHARLRLISLATGEITTLTPADRHVASIAWSPQGSELAYLLREAPPLEYLTRASQIERVAIAGGHPVEVCRPEPGGVLGDLAWSADGETILFEATVVPLPQSSSAIFAVPARGGVPQQLQTGDDCCAGELAQPAGAALATCQIAAGLETRVCWLDPRTGGLEQLYPGAPEDQLCDLAGWHVRQLSGGGTALAVVRSTGGQPWELWAGLAERPGEPPQLRQITSHQGGLAGLRLGSQEPFTWQAPDGLELDGLLVRPPDAPADEPLPTIVLVHGGPYYRWGPGFHLSWGDWTQWLATAGYAVLLPNPRGGSGHGERFAAAARGAVGREDYADVMSMVDAAIERGIADPERLGIGGWSQGGFMTAWAVTQTRRFKAGVMGAGVSDWGMLVMTSDVPDFERALGGTAPWEGAGPHPHAQLSPISFAGAVTTPLLILHGREDARVPVTQAIGFHRALREHNVPTELVVYPREPHPIRERAHQIDLLRRVRTWFDRWLRS